MNSDRFEHRTIRNAPRIVCLCGSTRFFTAFAAANFEETLAGRIVLTIGCHAKSDTDLCLIPEQKKALDELHLRKIDLADEILVLNVGGYIGDSTRRELEYARSQGKAVRFLEPEASAEEERSPLALLSRLVKSIDELCDPRVFLDQKRHAAACDEYGAAYRDAWNFTIPGPFGELR